MAHIDGGSAGTDRSPGSDRTSGRRGEPPGPAAALATLAALAAVIVGLAAIPSDQRVAAVLLAIGALALIVTWWFTRATETAWFRAGINVAVILALAGFACYLFIAPSGTASPKHMATPKAPRLMFADGRSAYFAADASTQVPFCRAYIVKASGPLPPGYQIVLFDAPADANGDANGDYSYDLQAKPIGSDRFRDNVVYIGSAQETGIHAEIVAALISDRTADLLSAVRANPKTGWGLIKLPSLLKKQVLYVTRTSDDRQCPGV